MSIWFVLQNQRLSKSFSVNINPVGENAVLELQNHNEMNYLESKKTYYISAWQQR